MHRGVCVVACDCVVVLSCCRSARGTVRHCAARRSHQYTKGIVKHLTQLRTVDPLSLCVCVVDMNKAIVEREPAGSAVHLGCHTHAQEQFVGLRAGLVYPYAILRMCIQQRADWDPAWAHVHARCFAVLRLCAHRGTPPCMWVTLTSTVTYLPKAFSFRLPQG